LTNAQALPGSDLAWFSGALRADVAYDREFIPACKKLIDQDEVQSWVVGRAKQGDGASLWLLSNSADNMADLQQRLREAAAAGFAQAQFDLAWAIIGGQQGAAGSGPASVSAGDLLRQSAEQLPRAEAQLALCEYYGCPGVTSDIDSAISHAREAAEKGDIDGIITIGPHLSASQFDPNEVSAWTLVNAWLQEEGCAGNGFIVQWMKATTNTLASRNISAQARALADRYWREYGGQMMSNLGCSS
jgi:TPR repeat protein